MPISLRWIASRRDRSHPKCPPFFFGGRAISPRAQASDEGARSRVQVVPSHVESGCQSVVYFLAQALGELAGAIDASLPKYENQVRRIKTLASEQKSEFTRLGATVRRLDDAQFFAVAEAPASGSRKA